MDPVVRLNSLAQYKLLSLLEMGTRLAIAASVR
jgi:hypothetical protein